MLCLQSAKRSRQHRAGQHRAKYFRSRRRSIHRQPSQPASHKSSRPSSEEKMPDRTRRQNATVERCTGDTATRHKYLSALAEWFGKPGIADLYRCVSCARQAFPCSMSISARWSGYFARSSSRVGGRVSRGPGDFVPLSRPFRNGEESAKLLIPSHHLRSIKLIALFRKRPESMERGKGLQFASANIS